jgi:hypothetical protein
MLGGCGALPVMAAVAMAASIIASYVAESRDVPLLQMPTATVAQVVKQGWAWRHGPHIASFGAPSKFQLCAQWTWQSPLALQCRCPWRGLAASVV